MEVDLSKRDEVANAGGDPIAFSLLQLISEARNEHGMRQQDYARYRRYCASKVHRLRELLSLTHADGSQKADAKKNKGAKAARGKKPKKAQQAAAQSADAKGHGNVFTAKKLDAALVNDARPAHLLLFEAERAWAYSQELRSEAFEDDSNPQLRKRGISRLRRAEQWSDSLHQLVQALAARFDAYARAETAAYLLTIKATTAFDRSQWDKALQLLSVNRTLLNAIAANSPTSRAEALANSFVDAGEAQMRYSAYQLGNSEQDMDRIAQSTATPEACEQALPGYAKLLQELAEAKANAGTVQKQALSLNWHGRQIPVRNPELLDTIVAAQSEEAALRDSVLVEAVNDRDASAATRSTKSANAQAKDGKRPRLSHAQRKAKKRELAQGESSADGARNATSSTARLGKAGRTELDPFDRALSAFTDAEDVARKLVDDNAEALSKSHSARYETASKDLQTAHDFVFYRLLALRIWRNLRLVAEVEQRAEKREKRAMSSVEARLKGKAGTGAAAKRSKRSKRKQQKLDEAAAAKKANPRKNPPGSRAKQQRSAGRKQARKPARSGTRKLRSRQALARENRARAIAAQKSKRRGARSVPSLAKLLDAAETSLVAMGSIGLIESEPDVSSLVEAKAAWFRSEILRHLARAFSLSGAHAEAVLLLTRAQLYIRQARQAAELAEDVDEEDADFPPRLKSSSGSDAVFDHSDDVLAGLKRGVQKAILKAQQQDQGKKRKAGSAMSDSRAGQALQELARKYIDFDPVSLEDARRVPDDVKAEYEQEQRAASASARKVKPAAANKAPAEAPAKAKAAAVPKDAPVKQPEPKAAQPQVEEETEEAEEYNKPQDEEDEAEEAGDVSLAYDPGNALAEEEEARLEAEAANKKKGWLGGWFGRG
ncbi:signal recognition particle 68 [Moesziomyces antarcticus]|uniref:Signal recognition particle subunit SRP68 n=1 Tax=Pseudozyma antarctica TaxID=84753 RepID=A0A5C3FGC2_PSEA2|nr:signal recognition particle 68 [Moesziomyces antarcticus]GAK63063.1 signal recognition particle 68 [Moesziomyces antarcticus]SPO43454.1 uncharacterized protein PSANT_01139 [Moesziomyces antarcticus]